MTSPVAAGLASATGNMAARVTAVLALTAARTLRPTAVLLGVIVTALPVLFAAILRATTQEPDQATIATFLLNNYETLVVSLLLPLTALVAAAGATSAEREDGTVLYLLTTTTPRWLIVFVRWLFATVLTSAFVLTAVVLTGVVAGGGSEPTGVMRAFAVGGAVGAAVYCALFLCMAIWLRRSLLVGLLYVLVWEGVIAGSFPAVRFLSARQVFLGITQGFVQEAEVGASTFLGVPSFTASVAWAFGVTVVALLLAVYRLQRLPVQRPR